VGLQEVRWDESHINIKLYLKETEHENVDRIQVAQGRVQQRGPWTFGFHKRLQVTWQAKRLSASQEGLSY